MVTEALILVGFWLASAMMSLIVGMFGAQDMSWSSSAGSGFGSLVSTFNGLASWVPFPVIGAVVSAVLSVWLGGFVVKTVRAAIAHLPQVGGAG